MKRKPLVAFFGIDGCGKTTLINELTKKLKKEGKDYRIVYMGLGSEHNMPGLKQIMKLTSYIRHKKKKGDEEKLRKYNYRQRNFLWVLGQFSEFWLRYRKAKKTSKKQIILFDRYFYDGLVFGNELASNFFKHLTPVPDKSFLIYAPAKTIRNRKKEADLEDIEKYYKKAEKLSKFFEIIKVDNTKKIEVVVNEIYKNIFKN